MPTAYCLNFDADDELASPAGYTPPRAVLARFPDLERRVGPLLGQGDTLIYVTGDPRARPDRQARAGEARSGRTWCPTPRALTALARAGITAPPAPALEILRRVNHRGFCAELGQTMPGARWATTIDEVARAVLSPSPTGRWLLKRAFGFAGRGRCLLAEGPLAPHARSWIDHALAAGGGVQVEPWVARAGDFGLHGWLTPEGAAIFGEPTVQQVEDAGAWIATAPARPGDLAPFERDALYREGERTAEALSRVGYFGPFGIDAFRWASAGGSLHLNARCDINARYSMGWATGMGARRPDRT